VTAFDRVAVNQIKRFALVDHRRSLSCSRCALAGPDFYPGLGRFFIAQIDARRVWLRMTEVLSDRLYIGTGLGIRRAAGAAVAVLPVRTRRGRDLPPSLPK
jgi:hypothetical protein